MAERRMFSKGVLSSDAFLMIPATAQLLYFHLGLRADDDGFVDNSKTLIRTLNINGDDLKLLEEKGFVITFPDGIVAIKHWRVHNLIRKDTYNETKYKSDKRLLMLDESGVYRINDNPVTEPLRTVNEPLQDCNEPLTQDRIDKDRIDKDRIDKDRIDKQSSSNQSNQKINYGTHQNIPLSGSEMRQLKDEFPSDWKERIDAVSVWVKEKNAKCNNFLETLRKWELHNLQQPQDSTKFNGYEQRNYDEEDLDEVVRKNTERLERQERAKLEALAEAEAEQAKPPTVSDDKPPDKSDHFNLSDEDYKEMVDIMRSFDLDPEQYPEECSKFTIKDSCKFVQWCNKEHKRQMETA